MEDATGVPPEVAAGLVEFTSRDWVHEALDSWSESDDRGLYICGVPGAGKSLLIADMVRRHLSKTGGRAADALAGWHFCRSGNDMTILPKHVISSLAAQLSGLPRYLEALTTTEPRLAAAVTAAITVHGDIGAGAVLTAVNLTIPDVSAERQFDLSIRAPLEKMASQGTLPDCLVLAIDGLNEALTIPDGELLVNLLARLLAPDGAMPSGVKWLLSGTPDTRITSRLCIPEFRLDSNERSADDVNRYILRRLITVLDAASAAQFAHRLTDASACVFLYARYVLNDLLNDPAGLHGVDPRMVSLPKGLAGYYAASLDRELTSKEEQWTDRYRPLLGALSVARGVGFTASELAGITGLPQSRVDDGLKRCSQYLVGRVPGPHRIFHQSFADYLRAEGTHTVYPTEAHAAVARYLAEMGGEQADRDLVWHLAGAGDLPALDRELAAERLAASDLRLGGSVVVDNLRCAASAAAEAGDVLRTVRWSWAAAGRGRYIAESVAPGLLPLVAITGGLDHAVRAVLTLDTDDLTHDEVITQLAVQLVEAGRTSDALAFVHQVPVRWRTSTPLAAVAERLASRDPTTAIRIARELRSPPPKYLPGICAGLAEAGEQYVTEAEELAGDDLEARRALVVATGRYDLDRALAIADRIRRRYELAAGSKVFRSSSTACADLVADTAARDPVDGAALFCRFVTMGRLRGDDAPRAAVATALRLGSVDGALTLALLEVIDLESPGSGIKETARGLVLAAAASGQDEGVQQQATVRWQRTTLCTIGVHRHDVDSLFEVDLSPLRLTTASRSIAREVLLHVVERIVDDEEQFEYPSTGAGRLAAAVAAVDAEGSLDALNRVFAIQHRQQANDRADAEYELVRALALVDQQRAFDLAMSMSGYRSHLALVALVDSVARVSIADALDVIDRIPTRYGLTRTALLGACARHASADDIGMLSKLRARLPERGESETFHLPFAEAGVALAASVAPTNPLLADRIVDQCVTGLTFSPALRDPYTIAQAVRLAKFDPGAALALAHATVRDGQRALGTIAVLRAAEFTVEEIATAVRDVVQPAQSFFGPEHRDALTSLIVELGARDLDLAVRLGTEFSSLRPLGEAAARLCELAFDRWENSVAVRRLVAAATDAPEATGESRIWTLRRRLTTLFDAQPPEVDALVLSALRATEPQLWMWLEPWALAALDPDAALALWMERGEPELCSEVIRRAACKGVTASLAVFQGIAEPSEYDCDALWAAIRATAKRDPTGTVAVVRAFGWRDTYTRSHAYRAAACGAVQAAPELAIALVEHIDDRSLRAYTIEDLAAAQSVAAGLTNGRSGLTALVALADPLDSDARRDAFEAIARALEHASHPPVSVTVELLALAAGRGAETFDRCLPHLISAASKARSSDAVALVAELGTVAELIRA